MYEEKYLKYKTKYLEMKAKVDTTDTDETSKVHKIKMHHNGDFIKKTLTEKNENTKGFVIRHLQSCNNYFDFMSKIDQSIEKLKNGIDPHITKFGVFSGKKYIEHFFDDKSSYELLSKIRQPNPNTKTFRIHVSVLLRTWESAFIYFLGLLEKATNINKTDNNDEINCNEQLILELVITPHSKEKHHHTIQKFKRLVKKFSNKDNETILEEHNYVDTGNMPDKNMHKQIARFEDFLKEIGNTDEIKNTIKNTKCNDIKVQLKYYDLETIPIGNQLRENNTWKIKDLYSINFWPNLSLVPNTQSGGMFKFRNPFKKKTVPETIETQPVETRTITLFDEKSINWNNKDNTSKYNGWSFFLETKDKINKDKINKDNSDNYIVNHGALGIKNEKHDDFDEYKTQNEYTKYNSFIPINRNSVQDSKYNDNDWICRKQSKYSSTYSSTEDNRDTFIKKYIIEDTELDNKQTDYDYESPYLMIQGKKDNTSFLKKSFNVILETKKENQSSEKENSFFFMVSHSDVMSKFLTHILENENPKTSKLKKRKGQRF